MLANRVYRTWLRPLPLALLGAWLLRPGVAPREARDQPDLARAVVAALAARGLEGRAEDVRFVDRPPAPLAALYKRPRTMLLAHRAGEPPDVYLGELRLSPEGRVLELTNIYNITDTSAVGEENLVVHGERAAWTVGASGKTYSVGLADLRGEAAPSEPDWTLVARAQDAITKRQETGSWSGIERRSFKLDSAAGRVVLGFSGDTLVVDADGRVARIAAGGRARTTDDTLLRESEHGRARPGNLVTWAVDRVRALPWFGSDRMQALKAVSFAALDLMERAVGAVTGDDGADRIAEEIGELPRSAALRELRDPDTGWPPPALEPVFKTPLEGEGQWVPLDEPFVLKNPGLPAPLAFTFVRVDRDRPYAQVFVTLWDPRQVELHTMTGTVEPKSATGETGPGIVPRKPEVMGRLLGGFNGGFQATHGEFGMMAEGVVYLPPKPYAATVAELKDGSTAFGTWPDDEHVADDIISFRQNMTPLVMDDTVNPYRRTWWGGVPPGWEDESHTVRSAICLTRENFVAYLFGSSLDVEHLTLVMQRVHCVYGIHLDMNPGHTGMEFYRAAPAAELPSLGRELDSQWEATGTIPDMPGWKFLGRRMIRMMGLMNFPRYIHRESRDFFYLTLRRVLPGDPLPTSVSPPEPDEGQWKVKGLPQHGFPYALAITSLRPSAAQPDVRAKVLRVDPKMVLAAEVGDAPPVVVFGRRGEPRDAVLSVWHDAGRFVLAARAPSGTAARVGAGYEPGDPAARRARAAFGVDPLGWLVYAELPDDTNAQDTGRLLAELLRTAGCSALTLLPEPPGVALGGDRDLEGRPARAAGAGTRLVRAAGPGARRIFRETPVVPFSVWYPLQAKRIRYFPKPKAEESGDAGAEPN
jgi:hypothetical protein